jgi:sugar phosphate isomerase/epimerase
MLRPAKSVEEVERLVPNVTSWESKERMIYTRRDFGITAGKLALATLPAATALANINSKFGGVQVGTISYSFRETKDMDKIVQMTVDSGLGEVELMYDQAEAAAGWVPKPAAPRPPAAAKTLAPSSTSASTTAAPAAPRRNPRPPMTDEQIAAARARNEDFRKWRLSVSMDKYKDIRKKFDTAGIELRLLCFNMNEAITDDEIEYAFHMAKALGVKAISSSTQVTVSKRIAPFADKHKMMFGFHGHDATWDPNEFATPESFATAMGYSKYLGVNLDIGHFTSGNYDAVAYIKEHHARVTNLHIKDRKRDHGGNTPWGQGDTPIKEVLLLLKKERYPIPANIEYEYGKAGMDTVTEVKKCVQFCKDVLA